MPKVFFNGSAGRIEGKLIKNEDEKAPIALVLHPHPVYGGTMDNKVVYNIYKTLHENGFTVLRINFRGVGNSEGEYDNGVGEMIDAAIALDWLRAEFPFSKFTLIAGFSFGAWIAMQLIMRRPEIEHFVAVSPPVNNQDFSFLSPCPIPGLILQGNSDSVVPESSVSDLAHRLTKQKNISVQYRVIAKADHFFREKLNELNEEIAEYVQSIVLHDDDMIPEMDEESPVPTKTSDRKIFLD